MTLTDHDTIAGALRIADRADVIIGEELSCWFPEDQCKMHVLVFGIDQAQHDSLTGLPNRFHLLDLLEKRLSAAQTRDEMLAVLFIDLDRFKQINDTLGHLVGDQILIQVAERLKSGLLHEDDVAGRMGGDEFTVILSHVPDHEFAPPRRALVDVYVPAAAVICVVRRIAKRLAFPSTPKHGRWLHRAEMEFSVLSRQCLDRRIATADDLAREVAAWERRRNETRTKIDWSFRVADARVKLQPIYPS